jgi:hypothetical protein
MVLETSHFYITLRSTYLTYGNIDFDWIWLTWQTPFMGKESGLEPQNFKKFLRKNCGNHAVGSIFSTLQEF